MELVKEPNKLLHCQLKSVDEITPQVLELISSMKDIMKTSSGVGLAANQVGQDLRIFVIDEVLAKQNDVPDTYINPEIYEYSKDKSALEEGCLSLPGYWQEIGRSKKIKIKAFNVNGKKIKLKARGFLARVLQHETDHLNGTLIKDLVTDNEHD